MKVFKLSLVIMAAFLITFGLSGMAEAFHDGGVAHCDGCHSMHNSADNPIEGEMSTRLTKGTDASSTCLNCHDGTGGYHVNSTDGSNFKAGGDFFWSRKSYTYASWSGDKTSSWQEHGHNITAIDYPGFLAESGELAPGGTYLASDLGCASCHDPHGQVLGGSVGPISESGSYGAEDPTDGSIHGNYRLLGDSKYEATGEYDFDVNAPVARANGSSAKQVDYGSGMSEWCANCHDYIGEPAKHVTGAVALMTEVATNYNKYVATGDLEGNQATAYDALVSFERGETDGSLLDETSTIGPTGSDNVMCLTCHRAHASAHDNSGRWDFQATLLEESKALISNSLTATEKEGAYYKNGVTIDVVAEYGHWQRSLCNKCHIED